MSHAFGPHPVQRLASLPETPWLQRIDARIRILASVIFAFFLVLSHKMPVLATGVLIGLGLILMTRLPMVKTIKRTLGVDLFIIFLLILLPFTTPGESWFTIGPLTATWDGFFRAVEISLKAMGVILALLALVGTLEPPEFGYALYRLQVPAKLVLIMLFTVRYLNVIQREYLRLRTAMKARAFVPRSNLHTWKTFGYLFAMLLVRSLERSERIYAAMKCRGFTGKFHLLGELKLGRHDGIFAALFLFTLAALGVWGWI